MTFTIDTKGLKASFPSDGTICTKPSFTTKDNTEFTALQFHFHARSEHTIDGASFPAELHIVHQFQNELAVIGIMMDTSSGQDNGVLQSYLDGFAATAQQKAADCEDDGILGLLDPILDPVFGGLFGGGGLRHRRRLSDGTGGSEAYDLVVGSEYYSYSGSLTTPPCSEIVRWHVMETALPISVKQYNELLTLTLENVDPETCEFSSRADPSGDTNRPVQGVNGRAVTYECS